MFDFLTVVARAVRLWPKPNVAALKGFFPSPALAWKKMRAENDGLVLCVTDYLKAELRRFLVNAPIHRRIMGSLKLSPILLAVDPSDVQLGCVILVDRLSGDQIFSGN